MTDFEGAPLFDDSQLQGRGAVFVGTNFNWSGGYILGVNRLGIEGWRRLNELKPINADGVAFLAIARAGAR